MLAKNKNKQHGTAQVQMCSDGEYGKVCFDNCINRFIVQITAIYFMLEKDSNKYICAEHPMQCMSECGQ